MPVKPFGISYSCGGLMNLRDPGSGLNLGAGRLAVG